MDIKHILLDLDGTVYPISSGLWEVIRLRMNSYMLDRMHLPATDVSDLRQTYYQAYGTTLRGLQLHHSVDTDDFLAYVHDLPLDQYLSPDPDLKTILASLPQPISIFTNADLNHAERVLRAIGLRSTIYSIIDIRALNFYSKPNPEAYRRALHLIGDPHPENCLMIDDSHKNLDQGAEFNMHTLWIYEDNCASNQHTCIEQLCQLPETMPELWFPG